MWGFIGFVEVEVYLMLLMCRVCSLDLVWLVLWFVLDCLFCWRDFGCCCCIMGVDIFDYMDEDYVEEVKVEVVFDFWFVYDGFSVDYLRIYYGMFWCLVCDMYLVLVLSLSIMCSRMCFGVFIYVLLWFLCVCIWFGFMCWDFYIWIVCSVFFYIFYFGWKCCWVV